MWSKLLNQLSYQVNIKPMVGSAWADLSRTALVYDENSFVAAGKDLPLLLVVFANLQEAIAVIWSDVCTTLLYLLKSGQVYLCLLMLIAAPKPTYDSPLHLHDEWWWWRKKRFFKFAQNWIMWSSKEINFRNFRFSDFAQKKWGKKSDSSLKIGKNFTKDFPVKKFFQGNSL